MTQPLLAQTHAGQVDTDGILSQGELTNPNIDYDKEQRSRERQGDYRVDNPYNDSAADRDKRLKQEERTRYDDRRDNQDYDERDSRYDDRKQDKSWWRW